MTRRRRTAVWFGAGIGAALAAALVALTARGTGEVGVKLAVIFAARATFAAFWLAYAGGALAQFVGPAAMPIARRGREFGLAFAGGLFVHLSLVLWLFRISAQPPVGESVIVSFGLGAVWTYTLALLSLEPFARIVSPRISRIFRIVGMEYIAFLFLFDFVIGPLANGVSKPLQYAPFAFLIVIGPILRLAAAVLKPDKPAMAIGT